MWHSSFTLVISPYCEAALSSDASWYFRIRVSLLVHILFLLDGISFIDYICKLMIWKAYTLEKVHQRSKPTEAIYQYFGLLNCKYVVCSFIEL